MNIFGRFSQRCSFGVCELRQVCNHESQRCSNPSFLRVNEHYSSSTSKPNRASIKLNIPPFPEPVFRPRLSCCPKVRYQSSGQLPRSQLLNPPRPSSSLISLNESVPMNELPMVLEHHRQLYPHILYARKERAMPILFCHPGGCIWCCGHAHH